MCDIGQDIVQTLLACILFKSIDLIFVCLAAACKVTVFFMFCSDIVSTVAR